MLKYTAKAYFIMIGKYKLVGFGGEPDGQASMYNPVPSVDAEAKL
jgi:hypothetical protein